MPWDGKGEGQQTKAACKVARSLLVGWHLFLFVRIISARWASEREQALYYSYRDRSR
jgi:uncharacterized DUF497 family protein